MGIAKLALASKDWPNRANYAVTNFPSQAFKDDLA